jgi:hypothetical protein
LAVNTSKTIRNLIGVDIAGPFKRTFLGNRYMVLAVDFLLKFCVGKALPDFTALSTARFLFEDIVCKFGLFKAIMSDNGVNFKARMLDQLCRMYRYQTGKCNVLSSSWKWND